MELRKPPLSLAGDLVAVPLGRSAVGLRGSAMAAGGGFAVTGRRARRPVTFSLGLFAMAARRTVFAFRLGDHRFDAIRMIGQPGCEQLGILQRQVDAHAVIFAVRIGRAVEVIGRIGLCTCAFGRLFGVGDIDDLGADRAAAHLGAVAGAGLVDHRHLDEIGLFLFLDRLGDAQRRADARHAVTGLVAHHIFADPVTLIPLDLDRFQRGAFKPVDLQIGGAEDLVRADKHGRRAAAAAEHDDAAHEDEDELLGKPELQTLHLPSSGMVNSISTQNNRME